MEKIFSLILMFFQLYFLFINAADTKMIPKKAHNDDTAQTRPIKITVLYDNYQFKSGTQADWGFACLIEGIEKTTLFDTGAKGEVFLANADVLGIDLTAATQLVLSHNHWDHTGGLSALTSRNPDLTIYVLPSFPNTFAADLHLNKIIRLDKAGEICANVFSTGEMGTQIKEQSLIINTARGLVIITGCSHQGILEVLKKAREIVPKDILLVMGGFHLLQKSDAEVSRILDTFKRLGVQKCGPTHCTGDKQIQMFKDAYGDNFITMGTGRIVVIDEQGVKYE